MRVVLRKMSDNTNALRTPKVEGVLVGIPTVGSTIRILAHPLDPEAEVRIVETSVVRRIEGDTYYTQNSVYHLTFDK